MSGGSSDHWLDVRVYQYYVCFIGECGFEVVEGPMRASDVTQLTRGHE